MCGNRPARMLESRRKTGKVSLSPQCPAGELITPVAPEPPKQSSLISVVAPDDSAWTCNRAIGLETTLLNSQASAEAIGLVGRSRA